MVSNSRRTLKQTSKAISQHLSKLEASVTRKLNAFYNQKIKPNVLLFPVSTLRQRYELEVRDIIRKAVQDSYLDGADVVNNAIVAKAPEFQLFTSVTDINNIAAITTDMANQFWVTTGKLIQRENEFVVEDDELVKKKSFDTTAALTGIAALSVFSAFNNAVKSKLPVALANAPIPPPLPEDNREFNIELDVPFEIREISGLQGRVRFTTQHDAKVDQQICAPLEGQEWDATDPDIVVPPDDTHRYCRCHLIPIVE